MKLQGKLADVSIDYKTNKKKLTFLINNNITSLEEIENVELLNIEVKKYRKHRSKDANSYFWKLLQDLCDLLNLDTIEEYKRRVRELGIFRQFKIEKENVKTFEKMWTMQGVAWFCEILDTVYTQDTEFKLINSYYGSSSYDSRQMSRLIQNLVQDCEIVGIQTKSKEEIDSLIREWEQVRKI